MRIDHDLLVSLPTIEARALGWLDGIGEAEVDAALGRL
jgi:hypothetical protein